MIIGLLVLTAKNYPPDHNETNQALVKQTQQFRPIFCAKIETESANADVLRAFGCFC